MRDSATIALPVPPNLPLGLYPETAYTLHPLQLRPGDRVLLITGGITKVPARGRPTSVIIE